MQFIVKEINDDAGKDNIFTGFTIHRKMITGTKIQKHPFSFFATGKQIKSPLKNIPKIISFYLLNHLALSVQEIFPAAVLKT